MLIGVMSLESPSKRRLAMITFEASDGWYGSQNTYFDLSPQTFDGGPHGINPPYRPATLQQAEFAFSKPVKMKGKDLDHQNLINKTRKLASKVYSFTPYDTKFCRISSTM